jgi:hypothetical protein
VTNSTITPFDSAQFRHVLGNFPTGVTVISAVDNGEPVGLAVGSFVSVSLEPAMVGFLVVGVNIHQSRLAHRLRRPGRPGYVPLGARGQRVQCLVVPTVEPGAVLVGCLLDDGRTVAVEITDHQHATRRERSDQTSQYGVSVGQVHEHESSVNQVDLVAG